MDRVHIGDLTLRGYIIGKFGGLKNFARHLGWSYPKLYRLLTGATTFTVPEFSTLWLGLGVPEANKKAAWDELYSFAIKSTNVTT